jgi:hypothetical protein
LRTEVSLWGDEDGIKLSSLQKPGEPIPEMAATTAMKNKRGENRARMQNNTVYDLVESSGPVQGQGVSLERPFPVYWYIPLNKYFLGARNFLRPAEILAGKPKMLKRVSKCLRKRQIKETWWSLVEL